MNIISFPKLGLTMTINNVAFSIGSKPVYWYALIILAGFFAGLAFCYFTCEKRGVKKDNVWDTAIYGLIAGIAGARIFYVVFDHDGFTSWLDIFKIWEGGLAIYGGIIGAAISTIVYCRVKKLNTAAVFDACAPGLLIGQAIGRFGNFMNAEVYGGETTLPWGMSINCAAPVHPMFLYESLWNILGFLIIALFRDKKKADGQVFCFYILWYSVGRLFMEGMRDSKYILYLIPDVLGISQLVAAVCIIVSASVLIYLGLKKKKNIKSSRRNAE